MADTVTSMKVKQHIGQNNSDASAGTNRSLEWLGMLRSFRESLYTVIGLTYDEMKNAAFSYNEHERKLSVRLPISSKIMWSHPHDSTRPYILQSTYLALVDEISTWAIYEYGNAPSQLGVSVQLTGRRVNDLPPGAKELKVVATIDKLGKSLAFLKAVILEPHSRTILFEAKHMKFIGKRPADAAAKKSEGTAGNSSNTIQDTCHQFSNKGSFCQVIPLLKEVFALDQNVIFDPVRQSATFRVTPLSSNGYTLHGGAHATLYELIAQRFVPRAELWHIQVDYLTGAPIGELVEARIVEQIPILHQRIKARTTLFWLSLEIVGAGSLYSTGQVLLSHSSAGLRSKL